MQLRSGPTLVRVSWALLPLTVGPALGAALDDRARAIALTGSGLVWALWAAVLVAVLVPRTVSLTALRIAAPAALGAAGWAAITDPREAGSVVGVTWAAITALVAFAPSIGDCFVNGSSYGDERRMPLRPPGALLLGPIELTWAAVVAAPVGVPLLVAAERWVAAGALAVVGVPAMVVGGRALHGLARRWIVFVPAGVVLHDLHAMVDPVLFPRPSIQRLGPARATDHGALDLTRAAPGLALELELTEPAELAPRRRDRTVHVEHAQRVLFTPTRPGAVLTEAVRRGIAVAPPATPQVT
ncbi:MAG TPA: hypothetical protein VGA36_05570 [Nitriliruptorales bacterium]